MTTITSQQVFHMGVPAQTEQATREQENTPRLPLTGAPRTLPTLEAVQVPRWDALKQSYALAKLAEQGISFFATPLGDALVEQLTLYFASPLVGKARRFGFDLTEEEVISEIISRIAAPTLNGGPCPAARAAHLADPFGYVWVCAHQWVRALHGHRAHTSELSEQIPEPEQAASRYTPLQVVVTRIMEIISPVLPEALYCLVRDAIAFLANHPPRRSYEGEAISEAQAAFPFFSEKQVVALSHVVWGIRPRQAETSFAGHLLTDPAWQPESPAAHDVLVALAAALRE